MKNSRKFILMLMALFAMTFSVSSCLDSDNDYESNDPVQYKKYLAQMSMPYSGKARLYYHDNTGTSPMAVKYDSLETTWTVRTDSTVTLEAFPICRFDSAIVVSDTDLSAKAEEMRALKAAISTLGTADVKALYYWPNTSFVQQNTISFYVNPMCIERSVRYRDADHKVYFWFIANYLGGTWTGSIYPTFEYSFYLSYISTDSPELTINNVVPTKYMRNIQVTCTDK